MNNVIYEVDKDGNHFIIGFTNESFTLYPSNGSVIQTLTLPNTHALRIPLNGDFTLHLMCEPSPTDYSGDIYPFGGEEPEGPDEDYDGDVHPE